VPTHKIDFACTDCEECLPLLRLCLGMSRLILHECLLSQMTLPSQHTCRQKSALLSDITVYDRVHVRYHWRTPPLRRVETFKQTRRACRVEATAHDKARFAKARRVFQKSPQKIPRKLEAAKRTSVTEHPQERCRTSWCNESGSKKRRRLCCSALTMCAVAVAPPLAPL